MVPDHGCSENKFVPLGSQARILRSIFADRVLRRLLTRERLHFGLLDLILTILFG